MCKSIIVYGKSRKSDRTQFSILNVYPNTQSYSGVHIIAIACYIEVYCARLVVNSKLT